MSVCVQTSHVVLDLCRMMEKPVVSVAVTLVQREFKRIEIIFAKGWGIETAAVCPIKQIQYLNEIGTYNQYWSREKSNNNLIAHWKRPSFVNLLVMLQSHLFYFIFYTFFSPSALLKDFEGID